MKVTVEELQLLPTKLYPVEILVVSETMNYKYGDCVQISFSISPEVTGYDSEYYFNALYSLVIKPNTKLGQLITAVNGGEYPDTGTKIELEDLVGKKVELVLSEEMAESGYLKTKILSAQPYEDAEEKATEVKVTEVKATTGKATKGKATKAAQTSLFTKPDPEPIPESL